MTQGLNQTQTKILTWVVYALIFILTGVTAWQQVKFVNLSNEYVRLERYKADSVRTDSTLCRIENKLDKLLMQND